MCDITGKSDVASLRLTHFGAVCGKLSPLSFTYPDAVRVCRAIGTWAIHHPCAVRDLSRNVFVITDIQLVDVAFWIALNGKKSFIL